MGKKVKRIAVSHWDTEEYQSWLQDMAKEGLFPKRIELIFTVFERIEAKNYEFRVDMVNSKKLTDEQKEIYELAGWNFAVGSNEFTVWYKEKGLKTNDIHTDSSIELQMVRRSLLKLFFPLAIPLMYALSINVTTSTFILPTWSSLIYGIYTIGVIPTFIIVMFLFTYSFTVVRFLIAYKKRETKLKTRQNINKYVPWKRKRREKISQIICFTSFIGYLILAPFSNLIINHVNTEELVLNDNQLSIVSLWDLENDDSLINGTISDVDSSIVCSSCNTILTKKTLLSTTKESYEHAWYGANSDIKAWLSIKYYVLDSDSAVDTFISGLVKLNPRLNENNSTQLVDDYFDFIIVADEIYENQWFYVFVKDNKIAVVLYSGSVSEELFIQKFEDGFRENNT